MKVTRTSGIQSTPTPPADLRRPLVETRGVLYYTVQPGNGLWGVARLLFGEANNANVAFLAKENCIDLSVNPGLKVGDVISVRTEDIAKYAPAHLGHLRAVMAREATRTAVVPSSKHQAPVKRIWSRFDTLDQSIKDLKIGGFDVKSAIVRLMTSTDTKNIAELNGFKLPPHEHKPLVREYIHNLSPEKKELLRKARLIGAAIIYCITGEEMRSVEGKIPDIGITGKFSESYVGRVHWLESEPSRWPWLASTILHDVTDHLSDAGKPAIQRQLFGMSDKVGSALVSYLYAPVHAQRYYGYQPPVGVASIQSK